MAGFHVTGVDHKNQPHYVGECFRIADALTYPLEGFDFIWASPPCQFATQMSARWRVKGGTKANDHEDLLTPTRERLAKTGLPFVIENVPGAVTVMGKFPLLRLSGAMFGLGVHRIRLFESNLPLMAPPIRRAPPGFIGVFGERPDGRRLWTRKNVSGSISEIRCAKSLAEAQLAMGMDWADWHGTKEAVPPAYAEFIGKWALQFLGMGG